MPSAEKLKIIQSVPKENLPRHIGIIMDGNSRWAKQKSLPQSKGHREGGKAVEKIIDTCVLFDIPVLTLYAFSTENWNRPPKEVKNLMQILREYLDRHAPKVIEKNIRFKILGDTSILDEDIRENLSLIEKQSKDKKKMTFCLAINYGGRDEIVRATKKILQDFKLQNRYFTESKLSCYLHTILTKRFLIFYPYAEFYFLCPILILKISIMLYWIFSKEKN